MQNKYSVVMLTNDKCLNSKFLFDPKNRLVSPSPWAGSQELFRNYIHRFKGNSYRGQNEIPCILSIPKMFFLNMLFFKYYDDLCPCYLVLTVQNKLELGIDL